MKQCPWCKKEQAEDTIYCILCNMAMAGPIDKASLLQTGTPDSETDKGQSHKPGKRPRPPKPVKTPKSVEPPKQVEPSEPIIPSSNWICPICNGSNEISWRCCGFCGNRRPGWICTECGTYNDAENLFCGECGHKRVN